MKIKLIAATAVLALFAGCSNVPYEKYAEARSNEAKYAAAAKIAIADALSNIGSAATATDVARTVSAMQLGEEFRSGNKDASGGAQAPVSGAQIALEWGKIIVPSSVQLSAISANKALGIVNSNNNARIAESSNATFLGLGQQIKPNYTNSFNTTFAPPAVSSESSSTEETPTETTP